MSALSGFSASQLGSFAIKDVLRRANLGKHDVDEVIMGNVLSAGMGQAPARQAAIFAGLGLCFCVCVCLCVRILIIPHR